MLSESVRQQRGQSLLCDVFTLFCAGLMTSELLHMFKKYLQEVLEPVGTPVWSETILILAPNVYDMILNVN